MNSTMLFSVAIVLLMFIAPLNKSQFPTNLIPDNLIQQNQNETDVSISSYFNGTDLEGWTVIPGSFGKSWDGWLWRGRK